MAQINKVPNPSFEDLYANCQPSCFNCFGNVGAVGWFSPHLGFVWSFSECYGAQQVSGQLPLETDLRMYQFPRTGNSIGSIHPTEIPFRLFGFGVYSYSEVRLLETLDSNKNYCLSAYVNNVNYADTLFDSYLKKRSSYATSSYGFYLSQDCVWVANGPAPPWPTTYDLNVVPQVQNPLNRFITDTLGWTVVKGIYQANGTERYLTFGSFTPDSITPLQLSQACYCNPDTIKMVMTFLDDFGVHELPDITAGPDDTICAGQSTLLAGNLSGAWWPGLSLVWRSNGQPLTDSLFLQQYVNPSQTTTYYLCLKDTGDMVPCVSEVIDSVTIYVLTPEPGLSAMADTSICAGDTLMLRAWCEGCTINAQYNWQPSTTLQNATTLQTSGWPTENTTYTLTLNDPGACLIKKAENVFITMKAEAFCADTVLPPPPFYIPSILGTNEVWNIPQLPSGSSLYLYDVSGKLIRNESNYKNNLHANELSQGMYLYKFTLPDGQKITGKLEVVK